MSAVARHQVFSAVHTVGGLLPADMVVRISEGKGVSGCRPVDYRVVGSRSVQDEAERHWEYLKPVWKELREKLPRTPETETPADPTGLAFSQWLAPLFAALGFGELTSIGAAGITSDDGDKSFPISHRWNHVPVHVSAWNSWLDRRPGGAGTVPPQSLVQECLNRSEAHLWGVITNGRHLRLLRDSSALATASYVEFDLEAIFDGEMFSEFVLLYRLLHVSRFVVADGAAPSACWLETWRVEAINSGTRALDQLRDGVQHAITVLGTGFLKHPDNARLRQDVDVTALHNALLRLAYRLLFVFVAEDRDALHAPDATEQAKERYERYFSTARLRAHARRRRGTAHHDLYNALRIVLDALGHEEGRPELGLPGLGGIFDRTDADVPLDGLALSNEYLLSAVRHLAQVRDLDSGRVRSIDYRHLDADELGSIYESLLELVPRHSAEDREFELVAMTGNARKTTGSYYTPSSLIECLLDSTLEPVIDDAVKRGEQAATAAGQVDSTESVVGELLSLTVCDPACGSGHFLVAAARRIAKRVAAVRERNPEPTLDAVRSALHDVIDRCIYGVDLNPMAVELAKVSLWLEALKPGKPLSFLDAHIKCGNVLVGVTPALLRQGIPDAAFKPIEGDNKKYAKTLEKQNRSERFGQAELFDMGTEMNVANAAFASGIRRITTAPVAVLPDVRAQQAAYDAFMRSPEFVQALHVADAWCAAFLWHKTIDAPPAITERVFRNLDDPDAEAVPQRTHDEVARLRHQYRFFHWHLEFPDVFTVPESGAGADEATGWAGGFNCVLGNPPWEHLELKEQEFFASRSPEVAAAAGAQRKSQIDALKENDPVLHRKYEDAKRQIDGMRHFTSNSNVFPLCGRGRIKTDSVFAEQGRRLVAPVGRMGVIVPTGIATDATTQYFFKSLVQHGSLAALYDFENRSGLFPAVDSRMKFCILSLAGRAVREPAASFAFFLQDPAELDDADKAFALTPEEITLLNPNTGTCPIFRSRRDAEITLGIYRRVPILIKEPDEHGQGGSNPWGVSFTQGLFNMTSDSHLFHTRDELEAAGWTLTGNVYAKDGKRMLPLYEAKMLHHYDHRWGTYDEEGDVHGLTLTQKQDPEVVVLPRYWVSEDDIPTDRFDKEGKRIYEAGVSSRLAAKGWDHDWLLGWRDICRATDERTMISSVFPRSAAPDGNLLMLPTSDQIPGLVACLSSLILDFATRQKVGGTHLKFFTTYQLPVASPSQLGEHLGSICPRIIELSYVAHDMGSFAQELDETGAPFRWDEERRAVIRAELDALFFHLYGISRDDVDYILDTFPIVKRKDETKYGSYRTKELILAEYDRMVAAGVGPDTPLVDGENYTSTLTPPPGHGPRHPAVVDSASSEDA